MKSFRYAMLLCTALLVACCGHGPKGGLAQARPHALPSVVPAAPKAPGPPSVPKIPSLFQMLMGAEETAPEQPVECGPKACVPTYVLRGAIDDTAVDGAIAWLDKAKGAGAKAIIIELDTPGGAIDEGHRLIRKIEDLGVDVHCVADNRALSQGFAILQSCTKRYMTKRTQLMAHQPHMSGGIQGARETQFENLREMSHATARAHAEQCAARLKISVEEYIDRTKDGKDWWMNWQEAEKIGAVDKIVGSVSKVREDLRDGKQP